MAIGYIRLCSIFVYMELLKLTIQSLSEQIITDQIQGSIELLPDRMIYTAEFYCKETDDDTGIWEEDVYRCYRNVFRRDAFTGVTVAWAHKEQRWYITMRTINTAIDHYCKDQTEAFALQTAILDWMLS